MHTTESDGSSKKMKITKYKNF